jgi:hypothetical protein
MRFKDRILQDATLHGMIVTLSDPSVSEALSECGLDLQTLWSTAKGTLDQMKNSRPEKTPEIATCEQ